jgi:fucose 4-O-acetylase-like acetyltransferase
VIPPPTAVRSAWLDRARAIGILLVVLSHAEGSVANSRLVVPRPFVGLGVVLYCFHTPLLFFVSGLLLPRALSRPAGLFLSRLIRRLIWPYVVWSVLTVTLQHLAGSNANHAPPWKNLLHIWYQPITVMWFLLTLAVIQFVLFVATKLGVPRWLDVAVGLGALGAHAFLPLHGLVDNLAGSAIWVVAGLVVTPAAVERTLRSLNAAVLAGIFAVCFFVLCVSAWVPHRQVDEYRVLATPAGIIAAVIAAWATPFFARRFLEWVGGMTLEIYVTHVIFGAVTRAVLNKVLHIHGTDAQLLFWLLGAMIGSLCAAVILKRSPFSWLVEFPALGRVDRPATTRVGGP